MGKLNEYSYTLLIDSLKKLMNIIIEMEKYVDDSLLHWHKIEVIDWLNYAKSHNDVEEIKSLNAEIANRFVYKYDVLFEPRTDLDLERLATIKHILDLLQKIEM